MTEERAGGDRSRYEALFPLASGGMATVYLGTVKGAYGFRRVVAIKKPHPHLVADATFRQAVLREARLASLIHHPNVVDVRDVEATDDDVSLIMDYVEGATLYELAEAEASRPSAEPRPRIPPGAAVRIVLDACAGLHAAHELRDERDRPLSLIHRDVSPQNLLVGVDGMTRVADFGVAKFKSKVDPTTAVGILKGKLSYMAPEYVLGEAVDRRVDVFAMGIVLWEILTGHRLFRGGDDLDTLERVLSHQVPPVSTFVPALGTEFDAIVDTALAKSPEHRFHTTAAMGAALESSARAAGLPFVHRDVAELVKRAVGPILEERRALVRARLALEPSVASAAFDTEGASTQPESVPVSVGGPEEIPLPLAVRSRSTAPPAFAPTAVMPGVSPPPERVAARPVVVESVIRASPRAVVPEPVVRLAPTPPAATQAPATLAIETLRSRTEWPPREGGILGSRRSLGFVVVAIAVAVTLFVVLRLRASSADAAAGADPSATSPTFVDPASAPLPVVPSAPPPRASVAPPRARPRPAPGAPSGSAPRPVTVPPTAALPAIESQR